MKKVFTEKLWKYMKISALSCLLLTITTCAAIAHDSHAQVLNERVTLKFTDVTLEEAINAIELAANVKFIYSNSRLNVTGKISVTAQDIRLDSLLVKIFSPLYIGYSVREEQRKITLYKLTLQGKSNGTEHRSLSQSIKVIGGKVVDATSRTPMAGVNIIVKGTTSGTTTDSEGNFNIESDQITSLIFSFIGYRPQEVFVNDRTYIEVLLEEDIKNLNEVVVNGGYYITTKKEQTGSIGKIEGTDIQRQPVANPIAAMQGRIPGLEIIQDTGVPGSNFKVRIRGINSLSNGNDPLYVIDGVPFVSTTLSMVNTSGTVLGSQGTSPLNFINPASIQSIEVLKDADATAIYGSRGANGVILITTKKPKEAKTTVDFNFYSGVAKVGKQIELLSTDQYIKARREAFKNDDITAGSFDAPDLVDWDTTRYTNWQKELLGKAAMITDAQFNINGGEKNTTFSLGTGYHRETTVFPGSYSDQRLSVLAAASNRSRNNKLVTSFSINYAANITNLPRLDLTSQALTLSPNAPAMKNEDGSISWTNWTTSYENPLSYTMRKYQATTNNLVANSTVNYEIIDNLIAKVSLGYTDISMKGIATYPISSMPPDPYQINTTSFSTTSFKNWIIEPQLNWKKKTGFGTFDLLAGGTLLSQTSEGLGQDAGGFASEALMRNIAAATVVTVTTNYFNEYRYEALFGRLNYNLFNRYIFNFTTRRDGSSRFGPNNRFASFGAIGAAWIFSEESWLQDKLAFISYGKLRASFGTTGNDQLSDYQYLDSYSPSSRPYLGTIGLQPNRLSNPNFAWEVNRKYEAALEVGFFENQILFNAAAYRNRSSNQLVGFPLPATTGFPTIQGNFPAIVQNQGLEFELTTHNIDNEAFSWITSFNLTIPRNKLVAFPGLEDFPAYNNLYVVGQPLSILKLYNNTGVDSQSGLYTFQDVNGDQSIDIQDAILVRFLGQKMYGGLSNTFEFKGIRLDALFQFVKQAGLNSNTLFGSPGTMSNFPTTFLDTWKKAEDNIGLQRLGASWETLYTYQLNGSSQNVVVDASYLRLKNLSISYNLPSKWISPANIQLARVFIQSQNLITITSYKGLDPETQSSRLPPLRTITAGIHITL